MVEILSGKSHIAMIYDASMRANVDTFKFLESQFDDLDKLGTSLNILLQAASCHRGCRGGCHMLERLCGRAYNLGCSALHLMMIGFYDEALGIIRIIGEISNLVLLASYDPESMQKWVSSDDKTRRKYFQPRHVRELLEEKGIDIIYASKEWYGDLSEAYIHITPDTTPNDHGGKPMVGSVFQKDGADKVINELCLVLCNLTLAISSTTYFDFPDLFAELAGMIRATPY